MQFKHTRGTIDTCNEDWGKYIRFLINGWCLGRVEAKVCRSSYRGCS